jgi:Monooxygenase af470-like
MTSSISPDRLTVSPDQSFVVFLIGARLNKWWLLPIVFGVSRAMGRMLGELRDDPASGLLSFESYTGRTSLMVQYWRSYDDLQRYARSKDKTHLPAWRRWLADWGRGAMGIWHETYVIEPGRYEAIYHHMPEFGLGRAIRRVPADGPLATGPRRLSAAAVARTA